MLLHNDIVKLADFGFAKEISEFETVTFWFLLKENILILINN